MAILLPLRAATIGHQLGLPPADLPQLPLQFGRGRAPVEDGDGRVGHELCTLGEIFVGRPPLSEPLLVVLRLRPRCLLVPLELGSLILLHLFDRGRARVSRDSPMVVTPMPMDNAQIHEATCASDKWAAWPAWIISTSELV